MYLETGQGLVQSFGGFPELSIPLKLTRVGYLAQAYGGTDSGVPNEEGSPE